MNYLLKISICNIKYISQQIPFPFIFKIICEDQTQKSEEINNKDSKISKSFFYRLNKPIAKVEILALKTTLIIFSSYIGEGSFEINYNKKQSYIQNLLLKNTNNETTIKLVVQILIEKKKMTKLSTNNIIKGNISNESEKNEKDREIHHGNHHSNVNNAFPTRIEIDINNEKNKFDATFLENRFLNISNHNITKNDVSCDNIELLSKKKLINNFNSITNNTEHINSSKNTDKVEIKIFTNPHAFKRSIDEQKIKLSQQALNTSNTISKSNYNFLKQDQMNITDGRIEKRLSNLEIGKDGEDNQKFSNDDTLDNDVSVNIYNNKESKLNFSNFTKNNFKNFNSLFNEEQSKIFIFIFY